MRRTLGAGALTGALLVAGLLPAAADPRIGLSQDGRSFAEQLTEPLFDPAVRWVPGDVRTETLWVRNDSGQSADLTVTLDAPALAGLLASGDVEISSRVRGSEAVVEALPATVAAAEGLTAGEAVPVELTVTMVRAADDATMRAGGALGLQVRLTESSAGQGDGSVGPGTAPGDDLVLDDGGSPGSAPAPAPVGSGGGPLATTGMTLPGWAAALGLVAVGIGATLLTRRGRSTRRTA